MKDYLKGDISGYGSHIPVLEFIFRHWGIKNPRAIELGMGEFSTAFLIDHCHDTLSIEQQDKDWFLKMYDKYPKANWNPIFNADPMYVANISWQLYDLILVDGAGYSRANSAAYAMWKKIDTVVVHDSENGWYGFATLDDWAKRMEYFDHAFTWEHPETRVFTRNEKLINAIQNL